MNFASAILVVIIVVTDSFRVFYPFRGMHRQKCRTYKPPKGAEWDKNGSFKCKAGFEMKVKTECWYRKTKLTPYCEECEYNVQDNTVIVDAASGAVRGTGIQNATECAKLCYSTNKCTTFRADSACFFESSDDKSPRHPFQTENEEDCKSVCDQTEGCTGSSFSNSCIRFQLPLLDFKTNVTFEECKKICTHDPACFSFVKYPSVCALYNTSSDKLVKNRREGATTADRLC